MKQIVQNFQTGELAVRDVPMPPLVGPGARIRTAVSLVSAGTAWSGRKPMERIYASHNRCGRFAELAIGKSSQFRVVSPSWLG